MSLVSCLVVFHRESVANPCIAQLLAIFRPVVARYSNFDQFFSCDFALDISLKMHSHRLIDSKTAQTHAVDRKFHGSAPALDLGILIHRLLFSQVVAQHNVFAHLRCRQLAGYEPVDIALEFVVEDVTRQARAVRRKASSGPTALDLIIHV